jgi:hypothetical protein
VIFVACFSELSDAVSQWTRYGGADGCGFALGFDAERIQSLKVPQYNHAPNGKLVPVPATIGGGPTSGQQVELTWGAFLQRVGYGDDALGQTLPAPSFPGWAGCPIKNRTPSVFAPSPKPVAAQH